MPGARFYGTAGAVLFAATVLHAAAPTTRPVVKAPTTPAEPRERPTLIDNTKPAFVPKFAQFDNPPAGQFAERQYANRYTYPADSYGFGYGCGYGGNSGYGCHGGGFFIGVEWSGGSAW